MPSPSSTPGVVLTRSDFSTRGVNASPEPASLEGRDLTQAETPLVDALRSYIEREPVRLHTPGHKGSPSGTGPLVETLGPRALRMDVPLLTVGMDAGPHPSPLRRAEALAARAWGARRTWFLANGASEGNHVACLALAQRGLEVVVQRNVHASTISGLVLAGLVPTFVAPEVDPGLGIAHCLVPEALDKALEQRPHASAAMVVSPTYYGAAADVRGLVEVAHSHGAALVVDEAWGAHFAFHEALPDTALEAGADLVVSSTHKMVGSLTQSAMLHLGHGAEGRIEEADVATALSLVATTSPSSLLLGSLDAVRRLAAVEGRKILDAVLQKVEATRAAVDALPGVEPLGESFLGLRSVHDYDPLRLAIDIRGLGISGYRLAAELQRTADINLELAEEGVVVLLFGMEEVPIEGCDRIILGLAETLARLGVRRGRRFLRSVPPPPWGEPVMAPREAFLSRHETVSAAEAVGRIVAESIAVYPPGIANVLPGERLEKGMLAYLRKARAQGAQLRGAADPMLHTVQVLAEDGRPHAFCRSSAAASPPMPRR